MGQKKEFLNCKGMGKAHRVGGEVEFNKKGEMVNPKDRNKEERQRRLTWTTN